MKMSSLILQGKRHVFGNQRFLKSARGRPKCYIKGPDVSVLFSLFISFDEYRVQLMAVRSHHRACATSDVKSNVSIQAWQCASWHQHWILVNINNYNTPPECDRDSCTRQGAPDAVTCVTDDDSPN